MCGSASEAIGRLKDTPRQRCSFSDGSVEEEAAFMAQQKAEENNPKDNAKDWKQVAEIFDRLFFWLFLVSMLISTLVLFHPLTKTLMKQQGVM